MNYYNEYDPKTAAWLRELIKVGAIPDGHVDERSIAEVSPDDLRGFTQCHFFAGIGGWSLALQLAGWSSDKPVWTGSCPCQPFSSAGKGLGAADERHLWPVFFELIRKCRPEHVFGEQVASAIGHGWLDGVSADLEAEGYACGATVLGAHSVGAPHIRQRLYWVAYSGSERHNGQHALLQREESRREQQDCTETSGSSEDGRLAHDSSKRLERSARQSLQGGSSSTFWSSAIWHPCRDGKARRIEPSIFPLVDGLSGRVGLLRGAGNAIVPQVAAEFIGAFIDVTNS